MNETGGASRPGQAPALAAAVWLLTAVFSAGPGLLLLTNAESRLPQVAGLALLLAGVVAVGTGAASVRGASALLLGASSLVVLLCLVSLIALGLDGQVSVGGWVLFGGAAAVFAVLAGTLMVRSSGPARGQ